MRSKARLFGHPIHQMLIVFPLGLLATSLVFDVLRMATGNPVMGTVAFWMIAAGVVGGLVAAPFGLVDWLAIPRGTRARSVGSWHGLGNLVVVILFIASWWLRRDMPEHPEGLAVGLSLAGVLLALFTGWLGGELVDRLGVSVYDGAHLDSPSSLSGRPASDSVHGAAPRR